MKLHIDIETYSSEDIKNSGSYRYIDSPDFEILMLAYAYEDNPVQIIDMAAGEELPQHIIDALSDDTTILCAHNAAFERTALAQYGYVTDIAKWECTMVKAAYCGFPLSLGQAAMAMGLEDQKDTAGKALIRYFCCPVKGTKANGGRTRNFWHHDSEKWEAFKDYCIGDVVVERQIDVSLTPYEIPPTERKMYVLDQQINDRGIKIDLDFVKKAQAIDREQSKITIKRMKSLTGLGNPNSPKQLTEWLTTALDRQVTTLAKDTLPTLLDEADDAVGEDPEIIKEVVELRMRASKTSIKKYQAMENVIGFDGRGRGFFQFYGANRTGRWAGRLVQLQNLPRIYMDAEELDTARRTIAREKFPAISEHYGDKVSDTLSQLIRTSFVAEEGHIFAVADFSAIEARVIAWLASEQWRIEVFKGHGKIYEASAAMIFGVPIDEVTKENGLRAKGKVAELALGYQGAVGALKAMGADKMGLSEEEMQDIVNKWRAKSPRIKKLWSIVENAAIAATESQGRTVVLKKYKGLRFHHDGRCLTIELPSGRKLFYQGAHLYTNRFDRKAVRYMGMDQTTKQWGRIGSYGGKFVENIVQAIARDILAVSMMRLDSQGYKCVLHVHDEAAFEIPDLDFDEKAMAADWYNSDILAEIEGLMGKPIDWAEGLPLDAEGYLSTFYKKD